MNKKEKIIKVLLIITIVILLVVIGVEIYKFVNDRIEESKEDKVEKTTTVLPEVVLTEKDKVKLVINSFVTAVNSDNLDEAAKYVDTAVIESIQKYNIANMDVDEETVRESGSGYTAKATYEINYNGITDIEELDEKIGKKVVIGKTSEGYKISSIIAN